MSARFNDLIDTICRDCQQLYLTNYANAALDDEQVGTKARDNPKRQMNLRKHSRTGYKQDTAVDSTFPLLYTVRLEERGYHQDRAVAEMVSQMRRWQRADGRDYGDVLIAADRGYAKCRTWETLDEHGFRMICVCADDNLCGHPFFPTSSDVCNKRDIADDFRVDDSDGSGQGIFTATYKKGRGATTTKLQAFAVRQNTMRKHRSAGDQVHIARFVGSRLVGQGVNFATDFATVPHSEPDDSSRMLFWPRDESAPTASGLSAMEELLLESVKALTLDQRCADWFILRRFSITGTAAAKLAAMQDSPDLMEKAAALLVESWTGRGRASEAMLSGQLNEDMVFTEVLQLPWVTSGFTAGLLSRKEAPHFAVSPDGLLFCKDTAGGDDFAAVLEIKSKITPTQVVKFRAVAASHGRLVHCSWDDATFKATVPAVWRGQIMHEAWVCGVQRAVLVVAQMSGILYSVVIQVPVDDIDQHASSLARFAPLCTWAHHGLEPPEDFTADAHVALQSHYPMWRAMYDKVMREGAFRPLRIVKAAITCLYNWTKGGVDIFTKLLVDLTNPHINHTFTQNVVLRMLKMVALSACTAARLVHNFDPATYTTAEKFKKKTTRVPYAEMLEDLCAQLVFKAAALMRSGEPVAQPPAALIAPAADWSEFRVPGRRKRAYFVKGIGVKRRLDPTSLHAMEKFGLNQHGRSIQKDCVLCRKKCTCKCTFCGVPVCASDCWRVFHSDNELPSVEFMRQQRKHLRRSPQ